MQRTRTFLFVLAALAPLRAFAAELPTWVPQKEGWGAWNEIFFSDENKVPRSVWCRYKDCWDPHHPAKAPLFVFQRISQDPFPVTYKDPDSTMNKLGRFVHGEFSVFTKSPRTGTAFLTTFHSKLSHYSIVFEKGEGKIVRDDGKFSIALRDASSPPSMTATGSEIIVMPPTALADDNVKPAAHPVAATPKPKTHHPRVAKSPAPPPPPEPLKPPPPPPPAPAQVSGTAAEPAPQVPQDATAYSLSDAERKFLTKAEDDAYVRRMAAAKRASDPDFKQGEQSQEDIVAEYRKLIVTRDPELNLKPEELAAWAKLGGSSETVKALIDKTADLAQRRKLVASYRKALANAQSGKCLSSFKNTKALLDHLNDHPEDVDKDWTGDCAASGAPAVGVGETDPTKKAAAAQAQADAEAAARARDAATANHRTDVPKPGADKVSSSDDGGKSWKKEVPAMVSGLKWGIWAAVMGMFLAGPMGIAMFALAGFAAGYGMSKLNKKMGE